MSERVLSIMAILRVETSVRRLECEVAIPDGSPYDETSLAIRDALVRIGGEGWREMPRSMGEIFARAARAADGVEDP